MVVSKFVSIRAKQGLIYVAGGAIIRLYGREKTGGGTVPFQAGSTGTQRRGPWWIQIEIRL
jgi:hypothetical protein